MTRTDISRRRFIRQGAAALTVGVVGNSIVVPAARAAGADDFGPLQSPDSNGHEVITTPIDGIHWQGGGFRCWHHPLVRESSL